MELNRPLVSVIIPVFDGEKYLEAAIESVLAQAHHPMEVIVVDDGSRDASARLIDRFRPAVRYLHRSNGGTAAARNHGVAEAKGEFFAFLDQDDLWEKTKLVTQIRAFEADPSIEIVFGHVKQFHSPDLDAETRRRTWCPPEEMPGISPSAMLIRREAFFRVGLFETRWRLGEWSDWYIRAVGLELRMAMLPELVALRRLHGSNKGRVPRHGLREYARLLKEHLDRGRARPQAISRTLPAEFPIAR